MVKSQAIQPPAGDSYLRIWNAVRKIPRGRVSTYGVIARLSGRPAQARLAGYALHNLPEGADVPWHRVVNSQGRISLPRARGSGPKQIRLLAGEGVKFTKGKIPLEIFGWPRTAFTPSRPAPRSRPVR